MRYQDIVKRLEVGESVEVKAHGNSMTPKIYTGDIITVEPLKSPPKKGDIVLAKVHGRYYFHLVTAVRDGLYKISNNHGRDNGWTKQVYGKVKVN